MAQMIAIAIDFDGVIHAYSKGWHDGTIYDEPVPGAFEAIEELRKTSAIAIFTTRDVDQVRTWLIDRISMRVTTVWSPPFWNRRDCILVTNIKPAAVVYIDDRALRFTSWDLAMRNLKELGIG